MGDGRLCLSQIRRSSFVDHHGFERMQSFGTHEVSPGDVAYLTDRVLVNEGKPQVYGTQFHEVNGHPEPRPIEDPDSVDVRRAGVGLGTLAEYRELIGG